jgi:hypothetical protein
LPGDKEKRLAIIDRFLELSPEDKINIELGRRLGIYSCLFIRRMYTRKIWLKFNNLNYLT